MISIALNWFKKQKGKVKLLLTLILIGAIFISYLSVQKAYYKYKYFKALETQVEQYKDSLKSSREREAKLIRTAHEKTITIRKASSEIDEKLKQDEDIIDNAYVGDDELMLYISKHQKKR